MDSGGREALLHFLESYDLGAVDLRAIAKTGALLDRKIASLPAERGWWLEVPVSGQLPQGWREVPPPDVEAGGPM
jgi:Mesyanzhinovviridae DNA primase